MVQTNVLGTALTARAVLPVLAETGGHLLLTGSVAGRVLVPGSLYSATKWAVSALAASIRAECVGTGVRVTLIQPGLTDTGPVSPGREADPQAGPGRRRPGRAVRGQPARRGGRQRDRDPADRPGSVPLSGRPVQQEQAANRRAGHMTAKHPAEREHDRNAQGGGQPGQAGAPADQRRAADQAQVAEAATRATPRPG